MIHVIDEISPATVVPGATVTEATAALLWDDLGKRSFSIVVFDTGKAVVDYRHVRYYVRGVKSIENFVRAINRFLLLTAGEHLVCANIG